MDKFIIFFILIGIFNVLSKMMKKKLEQGTTKPSIAKQNKKPYFTMQEVSPPKIASKPQAALKIDDLFRSIDETAGIVTKEQDFELTSKPEVVLKSSAAKDIKEVLPSNNESVFKSDSLLKQNKSSKISKTSMKTKAKTSSLAVFSTNPIVNGIIWSEILHRPKSR